MPERWVMRKRKVEIEGGRALWFYEFEQAAPTSKAPPANDPASKTAPSDGQGQPKGMLEDRTE
ncbi:MAG: hypothetical protein IT202_00715 [Fimbriimonadaceae bacterium]|nr:hypothetical protein [Fimbriimonadaceae bacterium]